MIELEYLGLDTLNDLILELAYSPTPLPNSMMVPLCFLFQYKGFIGLVEANYEFGSQQLVYGRKESDFYQSSAIFLSKHTKTQI